MNIKIREIIKLLEFYSNITLCLHFYFFLKNQELEMIDIVLLRVRKMMSDSYSKRGPCPMLKDVWTNVLFIYIVQK